MRCVVGLLLVVIGGCGHRTEVAPAVSANPPAAPASVASKAPAAIPEKPAAPPGPKVVLTIRGPGELEVEANGVSLATHVALERRARGTAENDPFAAFEPTEPFQLVESCSSPGRPPPACTTPDHPFRPVRWTGMTCGTQCVTACRATVPYGPATFRFVVSTCDHAHTYPSPGFEIGGSTDIVSDDRRWAAASTVRGTIARLELPPKWDPTVAPSATTIAGMTVKGSQQPLDDDARHALADALASKTGYDDAIVKRCAMGKLVGFKLTRTLPTTSDQPKEQTNEIAIDFTCQKIFIARGDRAPREIHASHFDPSRPAFLAIAKKYFADVK